MNAAQVEVAGNGQTRGPLEEPVGRADLQKVRHFLLGFFEYGISRLHRAVSENIAQPLIDVYPASN